MLRSVQPARVAARSSLVVDSVAPSVGAEGPSVSGGVCSENPSLLLAPSLKGGSQWRCAMAGATCVTLRGLGDVAWHWRLQAGHCREHIPEAA